MYAVSTGVPVSFRYLGMGARKRLTGRFELVLLRMLIQSYTVGIQIRHEIRCKAGFASGRVKEIILISRNVAAKTVFCPGT